MMIRREVLEAYIEHYRHRIEHWTQYRPPAPRELHHIVFSETQMDPSSTRERLVERLLAEALDDSENKGARLVVAAMHYKHACADPETAGTHLTEDWYFCTRWQQMGGEVHLLVDAALSHLGRAFYEGKLAAILVPRKEAAE